MNKRFQPVKKFPVLFALFSVSLLFPITSSSAGDSSQVVVYHDYPTVCPQSELYKVKINDRNAIVYYATVASFVSFESNDIVNVEINVAERFRNIRILPLRLKIEPEIEVQTIKFRLPPGEKAYLEIDKEEQLFIYGNRIVKQKPDPENPLVHFFGTGQVYEVGELVLNKGEQVYIEGGAVFRGSIRATSTKDVIIGGLGVMDGSYFRYHRSRRIRNILIEDCRDVVVRDLVMVEPRSWMITLYHSKNVLVDNVKQISHGRGTDGVDIVSSRDILVQNSMMRNGDDCIVIKSFTGKYHNYCYIVQNNHINGVENVLIRKCAVQSNIGGQAFEIGHELLEEPIQNIKYLDCDVLGSHDHGGVFGIHNADGANISNIVYENIRVDHYYDKLVDMRIIKSRFSSEEKIGSAENITLKDIHVTVSEYNPGYSISLIGGYDEDHKIKNVTFDNFMLGDEKVTNADQLALFTKHTENIIFR